LAEHLGLSPATISPVINRSSVADAILQETKDRILAAVQKYKYRPNFFARSLRAKRSFTIGVIVPEVSDGYSASVMGGLEDYLLHEGYFYFVVSHRHRADLLDEYPRLNDRYSPIAGEILLRRVRGSKAQCENEITVNRN
jgi:DNA-binding LacI/PurR family transcriptional regulator